jgi:hypothetical protein
MFFQLGDMVQQDGLFSFRDSENGVTERKTRSMKRHTHYGTFEVNHL